MKTVVIAGGTGTVGSRLKEILEVQGFSVLILSRNNQKASEDDSIILWDIKKKQVDDRFNEANIIINLAGAGIADSRWTEERKKLIINSRVNTTRFLIEEVLRRSITLDHFISASAIGFYGDGGHDVLTEESGIVQDDFLSRVCQLWEREARKASAISKQVAIIRIGTVLSPKGGALEKMSKTIPFGIANVLGSGEQLMSWIHVDDLCGIFRHIIEDNLNGIYNAVAPKVYDNKNFTRILRDTLNKHALLVPVPEFALKIALGDMSRVVLNSSNVSAAKIIESGYKYIYPDLQNALTNIYQNE